MPFLRSAPLRPVHSPARGVPGNGSFGLGRFARFIPPTPEVGPIFFADAVAVVIFHAAQIAPNSVYEQEQS
jgi:hypothetical protein